MATKRDRPKVADQIRAAIKASGKSRYEIFQASGVDQAALHRFVVKGAGLKVDSLEAIAAALGLEIIIRRKKGTR
jgi:hypothetical protein